MIKPKLIVTRRWPEAVESKLTELFDVTLNDGDQPLTPGQLQDALRNADAVCPTVSDGMSAEVIDIDGIKARILGNFGVGFNHIDLDAAKRRDWSLRIHPMC